MTTLPTDPRSLLLLTMADDELVTGHRATHWTGVAPSIEEDLAFATLAQDEIGHADLWLQLIAMGEGLTGEDIRTRVDELALGREPTEYRHAVLCERPPRDFAFTLARQWMYDHFDSLRLGLLMDSTDADIAAVAQKLLHEERYHLLHADGWMRRIAAATDGARAHLADGLNQAWSEVLGLFEPMATEDEMVSSGLLPQPMLSIVTPWAQQLIEFLRAAGLDASIPAALREATDGSWSIDEAAFNEPGGRHGVHTIDWTSAWEEMTHLHRTYPGAVW